ncbi:HNH endonuclease family protein, partial [Staphylococcus pasteuri_A]
NEETLAAINHKEIKNTENKLIRYILRNIYDQENNRELTINNDAQFVNLEHILPQNPKDHSTWEKLFDTDIKEYTYKLGNLT